jgi:hypothetical protein
LEYADDFSYKATLPLTFLAISICFIGPILLKTSGRNPQTNTEISCGSNDELLTLDVNRNSVINLVKNSSLRQSRAPDVRISDFRRSLLSFREYPELIRNLFELPVGKSIVAAVNYRDPQGFVGNHWLIVDSSDLPKKSGLASYCAKSAEDKYFSRYKFYYSTHSNKNSYIPIEMSVHRAAFLNASLLIIVTVIMIESVLSISKDIFKRVKNRSQRIDS